MKLSVKNKILVVTMLIFLNFILFALSTTIATDWVGSVLHDGKERLRVGKQVGQELFTQTSVTTSQISEFGYQDRKGTNYSFYYSRIPTGYIVTTTKEGFTYSVKVRVYSIDEQCSLLILPTEVIDNLWLTCLVE